MSYITDFGKKGQEHGERNAVDGLPRRQEYGRRSYIPDTYVYFVNIPKDNNYVFSCVFPAYRYAPPAVGYTFAPYLMTGVPIVPGSYSYIGTFAFEEKN